MATAEPASSVYDHYGIQPNLGLPPQTDFVNVQGVPQDASPLSQSAPFREGTVSDHPSSLPDGYTGSDIHRMNSTTSQSHTLTPSRVGTLKKKQSLSRKSSLKRSGSRRSSYAGSVRSLALGEKEKYGAGVDDEINSAFYTPVPTRGIPTDVLANRFQAWRKVLKDLIAYFRDIQKTYDARSKALQTLSNVINNTSMPPVFLTDGGIGEANRILREYHRQALNESSKAKDIENDVIIQLSGLRSDLQQKIKEIKNLSGDFKNSVDKEMDATRKAARSLQEALGLVDEDPHATTGKGDPFLVKITVEEQVARQIEEENYLHRAFLNLESSGRELESIVVGEIQKAYNAYAGILKREADEAYDAVEKLRSGPITMPKDLEWSFFVERDENFVDPKVPLRQPEQIYYPGKEHPAAAEVRSGMLERKSKYLKSYTPGWYVLSPTHLHEFKSPERIGPKTLVMSLYLPEQKLGSHSQPGSSSHKFMLKGRQTGSMHRGHSWIFRAESHDTMLAWYQDIKSLTEKSGEERNAFVRKHARSHSGRSLSRAGSVSSEGAMEEDEADETPYSANASLSRRAPPEEETIVQRPSPGGRFPSDIQVNRDLQVPVPLSPSSRASSGDPDAVAAAGALPGSAMLSMQPQHDANSHNANSGNVGYGGRPFSFQGSESMGYRREYQQQGAGYQSNSQDFLKHDSKNYGDWMAPAARGTTTDTIGVEAYDRQQEPKQLREPSYTMDARDKISASPTGLAWSGSNTDHGEIGMNRMPYQHDDYGPAYLDTNNTSPYKDQDLEVLQANSVPIQSDRTTEMQLAIPIQQRQPSGNAISNLHIPGEFPQTPAS
ncbi:MAG: hypothetical protein M1834_008708 [Cirrosporium novae-zelandiae]|nr:MAG: hypothetical protein M1834_008708 [Cirrosporium novae-zelandiae]